MLVDGLDDPSATRQTGSRRVDSAAFSLLLVIRNPEINGAGSADPIPASTADTTPKAQPAALMQETVQGEYNQLDKEETRVILNKGTEWRGTGKLYKNKAEGTYICRQCNAALYTSEQKFESGCGWPSFDDEIDGAVTRKAETDGTGRTEIICTNCDGHLGHVFLGEGYTEKNTRHCVNSVSMSFVPAGEPLPAKIVH